MAMLRAIERNPDAPVVAPIAAAWDRHPLLHKTLPHLRSKNAASSLAAKQKVSCILHAARYNRRSNGEHVKTDTTYRRLRMPDVGSTPTSGRSPSDSEWVIHPVPKRLG